MVHGARVHGMVDELRSSRPDSGFTGRSSLALAMLMMMSNANDMQERFAAMGVPQQHRQTSILGPPPLLAGHRPAC